MQNLLKALLKHLDTIGTLKVSNSSAAVYALSNGKEAVVWLDEHDVKLMWGDLSSSDKEIFRYDGNKEKFQTPIEIRARDYNEIDD